MELLIKFVCVDSNRPANQIGQIIQLKSQIIQHEIGRYLLKSLVIFYFKISFNNIKQLKKELLFKKDNFLSNHVKIV